MVENGNLVSKRTSYFGSLYHKTFTIVISSTSRTVDRTTNGFWSSLTITHHSSITARTLCHSFLMVLAMAENELEAYTVPTKLNLTTNDNQNQLKTQNLVKTLVWRMKVLSKRLLAKVKRQQWWKRRNKQFLHCNVKQYIGTIWIRYGALYKHIICSNSFNEAAMMKWDVSDDDQC